MRVTAAIVGILFVNACSKSTPPERAADSSGSQPSLNPPADLSHGEAPIGPAQIVDRAADAPPPSRARHQRIRMVTVHVRHQVAPGVITEAWTFDSVVPGPSLRLTVGDTADVTLVNRAPIPHSVDFHAAEIAPDRAYRNVMPGDSIQFRFVARVPGAFMYHCGTAPVAAHIASGMYGALIVDPRGGRPAASEFVLVQSEFYLGRPQGPDSVRALDWDKVLNLSPDYVAFNGVSGRYATKPIPVGVNAPIRMFVVNAGPNRVSAFHVVGGIFDRVLADGFGTPLRGVQTWNVPVGGGMVYEFSLAEAGTYPFVSHAFSDATKGAVGVLQAGPR
jgi:nitrite reductase (NO-forming)